jgi:hypothetical protein
MSLFILKYPTPKRLRVIDGLIAEHLFKWKWFCALGDAYLIPPSCYERVKSFRVHWTEGLVEDKYLGDKHIVKKCNRRYDIELVYSNDYGHMVIPRYTTNRADAFLVIEELAKKHVTLNIIHRPPYKPPWMVHTAAAHTLELAVCLYTVDRLNLKFPWSSKPQRPEKAASPNAAAA